MRNVITRDSRKVDIVNRPTIFVYVDNDRFYVSTIVFFSVDTLLARTQRDFVRAKRLPTEI